MSTKFQSLLFFATVVALASCGGDDAQETAELSADKAREIIQSADKASDSAVVLKLQNEEAMEKIRAAVREHRRVQRESGEPTPAAAEVDQSANAKGNAKGNAESAVPAVTVAPVVAKGVQDSTEQTPSMAESAAATESDAAAAANTEAPVIQQKDVDQKDAEKVAITKVDDTVVEAEAVVKDEAAIAKASDEGSEAQPVESTTDSKKDKSAEVASVGILATVAAKLGLGSDDAEDASAEDASAEDKSMEKEEIDTVESAIEQPITSADDSTVTADVKQKPETEARSEAVQEVAAPLVAVEGSDAVANEALESKTEIANTNTAGSENFSPELQAAIAAARAAEAAAKAAQEAAAAAAEAAAAVSASVNARAK